MPDHPAVVSKPSGTVLLVDDDPDVRRDYAKVLKHIGVSVETAESGFDAITRLRTQHFDLILSDLSMPGMTGLQFLRAVRQRDLDVPVVLMTGAPSLDSAVEAVAYGAFRYLLKPITSVVLGEVVARAIHMHELARLKREALAIVGTQGMQLGDRATLEARFAEALEHLWVAFQPIVRTSERTVLGYEALVRSSEVTMATPADLLGTAERLGQLKELGRVIRTEVARSAAAAPEGALLFVNVHPLELDDNDLCSPSAPLSQIAERVVLEITERASLDVVKGLDVRIEKLRKLGFRLAIDDLGAGYAGLTTLTLIAPDFVKLDRLLVKDLDTSARKRSVIHSLVRLCGKELGIQVIAEGVETDVERAALQLEGCDLMQGFLFGSPELGFMKAKL